jgi:regulator of protease activity HflC (stomatin/prohibitin superfamily)
VPSVTVETIDVARVETAPLRDEARALVPASDYVEATAAEGTTVVRYVDGALEAVLGAGRHAAWTVRKKVTLAVIDLREKPVQVTTRTLDELLDVGVKDLVLPGEMKTLLNRVIEAQKEAEANVILRREETAATRSMAQTARVLAENPLLVRLKELEAYKELAAKVGQVHLVLGEGALPQLQLKA